jgi:hypothetical protein
MRCYFMKEGHIVAVQLLEPDDDEGHIRQAKELFDTKGKQLDAEGFEVWVGPRFLFRFPADLKTPKVKP